MPSRARRSAPPITLRRSEVKRNLGIDHRAGDRDSSSILDARPWRFGSRSHAGSGAARRVYSATSRIPTWRLDVEREIDLLEELARIYGYNKFPNTLPAFVGAVVALPDEPKNAKVRETMLALGYDEVHLDHLHLRAEDGASTFGDGGPNRWRWPIL